MWLEWLELMTHKLLMCRYNNEPYGFFKPSVMKATLTPPPLRKVIKEPYSVRFGDLYGRIRQKLAAFYILLNQPEILLKEFHQLVNDVLLFYRSVSSAES